MVFNQKSKLIYNVLSVDTAAPKNNKVEEQRKVWGAGKGGWTQERKPRFPFGPRLNLVNYEMSNELMYYLHMLPVR